MPKSVPERGRLRQQRAALNAAGRPDLSLRLALLTCLINVIGFAIVVHWGRPAWVTNDLGPLIDGVLLAAELVSSGFLRLPPLRQMVFDQRSGRQDQSKQFWQLLSMELRYRSGFGCRGRAGLKVVLADECSGDFV